MTKIYDVVNFLYFYRDGANWKNNGNAQFTNKQGLSIEEIKRRIQAVMLNSNDEFHPEDVDLDTYFFCDCQYENGDYHEFDGVEFSQSAVCPERDIIELIATLEASKVERSKPKPPKPVLFKFTYQHKLGEPEIIRYHFIAAYTYEEAVELGNRRLAKDFPGEQNENTFYSVDGTEAAKMVDCQEISHFYPDEFSVGIGPLRFKLYPDLSREALQAALALLAEFGNILVDETVGRMEKAGLFKPGQLDAPRKDGEQWQQDEQFGAMMAVDYLRSLFAERIAALLNGADTSISTCEYPTV